MKRYEFQIENLLTLVSGPVGSATASITLICLVSWIFVPAFLGKVAILELINLFSVMALTLGLDQASVREYASAAVTTLPALLALNCLARAVVKLLFDGTRVMLGRIKSRAKLREFHWVLIS